MKYSDDKMTNIMKEALTATFRARGQKVEIDIVDYFVCRCCRHRFEIEHGSAMVPECPRCQHHDACRPSQAARLGWLPMCRPPGLFI